MNPTENVIDGLKTRYVTNVTGSGFSRMASESISESDVDILAKNEFIRRDFEPAQQFKAEPLNCAASRSALPSVQKSVPQIEFTSGTTKELWVDSDSGSLILLPATLRAAGTHCCVWIVDDYYVETEENPPENKVTAETAGKIQQKFDAMYPLIRNVFGEESDYMVNSSSQGVPITEVSDTGETVNIVLYDIEGDYKAGQMSGTFGYFWAKDYYARGFSADAPVAQSNEGKYFYIDSYFANKELNMIYSTLAHEFQHMIHFGVKWLTPQVDQPGSSGAISETWYNEMLSMLCEDMMQSHLEIDNEKSPKARLAQFCAAYPRSGITDWLGDNVLISYATSYAFGAYLARNYGGANLVKEIAQNSFVNRYSITDGLKRIGSSETFDSVFNKYTQALLLSTVENVPSFNKDAAQELTYNGNTGEFYSYPMTAIDLLRLQWRPSSSATFYTGPAMFKAGSEGRITLRPYGFTLHYVDSSNSAGNISLTFSQPLSSSEKMYILLQPCSGS